jgi:hypothetical protein
MWGEEVKAGGAGRDRTEGGGLGVSVTVIKDGVASSACPGKGCAALAIGPE